MVNIQKIEQKIINAEQSKNQNSILKKKKLIFFNFVAACDFFHHNLAPKPAASFFAKQFSSSVIFTTGDIYSSTDGCIGYNCWGRVTLITTDSHCNTINLQFIGWGKFSSGNIDGVATGTYNCQYQISCKANYIYGDFIQTNIITVSNKCYTGCAAAPVPSICSTGSYDITSSSITNSYTVNQYSGSYNSNAQTAVIITQYFQIPGSTCEFTSCSMYLGAGVDTSVDVNYAGSGPTATVIFTIDTSVPFSKTLNLKCVISENYATVQSINTITFTVNPCFSILNPSQNSYVYSFNQNSGSVQEVNLAMSNYFTSLQTGCYFDACEIQDASENISPQVRAQLTGTYPSQVLIFTTTTSSVLPTQDLYLNCLVSGSTFVLNNNPIHFTVNPCMYSSIAPNPSTFIYYQYQNSGNTVESGLYVYNYFGGLYNECYFQSCVFLSGSTISNLVTAAISGAQTSQGITFTTNTLNAYTATLLKLKCLSIDNIYHENNNLISFTVRECIFTSLNPNPQSYSLQQYYGNGMKYYYGLSSSNFIGKSFNDCILINCKLIDKFGNQPAFAYFVKETSSTYQLQINTKNLTLDLPSGSTQIKVICYDLGSNLRASQFLSIQIICGPNSVVISPPSNFMEVTYYQIKNNTLAQYLFDNFTSSNPANCPIISHKLAIPPFNPLAPSYISIIEGQQQFKIINTSMSNQTFKYSFYVIATAKGGAVLKQKVSIYNFKDCKDDIITLTQSFPDNSDPNYNLYAIESNNLVLKTNQSYSSQFKANLKSRFTNILSSFCPLIDFKIEKVICDNKEEKDFKNFLSINSKGVLEVLESSNKDQSNCHVYVAAFNSLIWGGNFKQYLADISLYQENSNFKKGILPQFIDQPQSYEVDLTLVNLEYFNLQLPNVNAVTSQIQLNSTKNIEFLSVYFDKQNQSCYFHINSNKIKALKEYEVEIKLVSDEGKYQNYKIKLNITKSKGVSAKISSIDQYGEAVVQFSEKMFLNKSIPWINYTKQNFLPFNNSWINQSNTILKILPALDRDQYEEFNETQIKLSWYVKSVTNLSITFQIVFDNPLYISPLITQDRLQIQFNGSQYIFVSQKKNLNLYKDYWKLTHKVRKQLPNNSQTKSLNFSGECMNKLLLAVLILSIFLNIIGEGCVEYMLLMFRSLQIVLHFPILQVVLPANAITFFQFIFSLVQFDIFDNFPLFDYLTFIDYDLNKEPKIIPQMIDIGYNDRNAFSGLKILTLVLLLYLLRVLLSLFTGMCGACLSWKNKKFNKMHSFLTKGLYFNQIIRISMEAYFEFYLIGYMNYQTLNFSLIGEKLGAIEAGFVLFMILIVLESLSIFILFKTKNQLQKKGKKNLKHFIGELYESTKIESSFQRAYTLLFLLRRFSFLSIGTFIQDPKFSGIQIVGILLLNLVWVLYICHAQAQKQQLLNQIERVNEIFVQLSTALLTLFTAYVQSLDLQYMYGWFLVASLSLLLTFNLFFIFNHVFKIVKQVFLKFYNYMNFYYSNKRYNYKKDYEINLKEIELKNTIRKIVQNQKQLVADKLNGNKQQIQQKLNASQQQSALPRIKIIDLQGNILLYKGDLLKKLDKNIEDKSLNLLQTAKNTKKKNQKKKLKIKKLVQQSSDDESTKINNNIKQVQRHKIVSQKAVKINLNYARIFIQNLRTKRSQSQKITSIQDQTEQDFNKFLQKHRNIFLSCVQANNSFQEIEKDFKYLSFVQTDTVMDIRLKEIQISQYVQYILLSYSNLEDPQTASKVFNQWLYKFTDDLIYAIKQQQ